MNEPELVLTSIQINKSYTLDDLERITGLSRQVVKEALKQLCGGKIVIQREGEQYQTKQQDLLRSHKNES